MCHQFSSSGLPLANLLELARPRLDHTISKKLWSMADEKLTTENTTKSSGSESNGSIFVSCKCPLSRCLFWHYWQSFLSLGTPMLALTKQWYGPDPPAKPGAPSPLSDVHIGMLAHVLLSFSLGQAADGALAAVSVPTPYLLAFS